MTARRLTASERDWLTNRSYLNEHRYELAVDAAEDYPPGRRMIGTPLLAAPGWLPPVPIPLQDIGLELTDADPEPRPKPSSRRRRPSCRGEPTGRATAATPRP
jgi:hypothetical protein